MIKLAIDHYHGQMSEVARRLGIGRSTLYRKLKEYGIDPETGRSKGVEADAEVDRPAASGRSRIGPKPAVYHESGLCDLARISPWCYRISASISW